MSNPSFEATFLQLSDAVRQAGGVVLSMWPKRRATATIIEVAQKIDGSLVSEADMASNELLTTALHSLYPSDLIFSEEVMCDPAAVFSSKRTWIIDPLDGTSAFLEGRDDFSILVGLSVDHTPTQGLCFFPRAIRCCLRSLERVLFSMAIRYRCLGRRGHETAMYTYGVSNHLRLISRPL